MLKMIYDALGIKNEKPLENQQEYKEVRLVVIINTFLYNVVRVLKMLGVVVFYAILLKLLVIIFMALSNGMELFRFMELFAK